jgi:hypothetical protein
MYMNTVSGSPYPNHEVISSLAHNFAYDISSDGGHRIFWICRAIHGLAFSWMAEDVPFRARRC